MEVHGIILENVGCELMGKVVGSDSLVVVVGSDSLVVVVGCDSLVVVVGVHGYSKGMRLSGGERMLP